MNRFRVRLTLIIIGMIGLSVLTAGLFMAQTFRNNHLDALQDNMLREMKIMIAKMEWPTGNTQDVYTYFTETAKMYHDIAGVRVTFIRGDGTVLGDSGYDAQLMENHFNREEIREAREDGIGREIRRSDTTQVNSMYVAIPIDPGSPTSDYVRLAMSLQDVDESVGELWTVVLIGLVVLFILAALVSYRIARGLTRPLESITRVAQRIKNMDYQARVSVRKTDEIGELAHAINAMADSLQGQMRQLKQNETRLESVLDNMINGIVMIDREGTIVLLNRMAEEVLGFSARELVGRHYAEAKQQYELAQIIQEGLEEREHIREEITFYYPDERLLEIHLVPVFHTREEFGGVLLVLRDVTEIRRLERMRSEFVANVSHELKTPIAAVKGFAETLLGGAVNDPATANSFLQIIFDESERLNRLIGDILELSKVESRRVPLQLSPVEMSPFVARTMEFISSEATRKHISLEMSVEEGLYVEADEDRLSQILINLLANGVNYTPEGGKVSITVEPVHKSGVKDHENYDMIRIKIADTGIGIPKKDLPRIFERFYRVDKARSRSSGGTGLGLSIVKHLVELHKGTIVVDSSPGVGSTFTIELPVLHS
ncbi:two-component system histidine kinase PnpS [Paenibacillus daejeonensis]|uniref:two-component system histidine kinase PnpS n=1 Tax=Paenibacillus daejeonensis TaxID=135193 RepID=UPI0003701828|nr:ATP-binding protein [Paenibacillus daejeonensis]